MSLNKLGRYEIIRVLGKGAMGLVYEARDPNLDRRVAIKTIKVENLSEEAAAEYEARFRTEARSAARLQHPNIVSVYDSDRHGDMAFLVMEFIQGEDLKHHLDAGRRYSLAQSFTMMRELLSALEYAHRQNIVHRDVKPANLLLEVDGRVKLTDFGVARIQDSGEATRTQGSMVGTLKYMSPEQMQGQPIDARADLFAVGIVLYQLLTGKRPFDGDTDFAIIQQIVGHTPPAPSTFNPLLPPAMDAVVARALAKKREQRFATAQEFSAALQDASNQASDPTVVPPASPPGRRTGTATDTGLQRSRAGGSTVRMSSSGTDTGSTVTQELELVYWKDIKDSDEREDLEGFLDRFPSGIYADLARRRLKRLGFPVGEEGSFSATAIEPGDWTRLQAQQVPMPAVAEPAASACPEADATHLTRASPAGVATPALATPEPAARPFRAAAAPPAAAPAPRRFAGMPLFALAGAAVLVLAGVAFKLLAGAPAPAQLAATPAQPASLPASAAAASVPLTPPPKRVAAPAAADKPAGRQALGRPAAAESASAAAATDRTQAPAAPSDPQAACEHRMLLGFQICMNESCAKPAFSGHAACVERRAMEKLRREAQEIRN